MQFLSERKEAGYVTREKTQGGNYHATAPIVTKLWWGNEFSYNHLVLLIDSLNE